MEFQLRSAHRRGRPSGPHDHRNHRRGRIIDVAATLVIAIIVVVSIGVIVAIVTSLCVANTETRSHRMSSYRRFWYNSTQMEFLYKEMCRNVPKPTVDSSI